MRRPGPLTLISAALVLLLLSACNSDTFETGLPPGGDGGSSSGDGYPWPGPQSDLGNPDPTPKKDMGACGKQSIPIKLVVKGDIPDLFLVVDRSGSMVTPIDLFNWALGTKWTVMRKTLSSLVDYYSANIRFGLSLFPSDNACAAGKIDIPLKMGNSNPIKTKLQQTNPNGSTPTHTTLDAVRVYLSNVPPAKGGRFVLLATDGVPNCGAQADTDTSAETLAAVQKLAASGAKVVVLGFGSVVAGNPGLLNQLAAAGGAPNKTGPQKFYPAANEAQLKQALFTIAGGIIPPPCTYKLNKLPPDPEKVTVTFDGVPVPRSKSSKTGWNYTGGGTEITFFGSYCNKLRTGGVKEVKFFFGCKGPVIE